LKFLEKLSLIPGIFQIFTNLKCVRKKTIYLKFIIRLLEASKGATRRNLQTRPKILKKLLEYQINQPISTKIFPKKSDLILQKPEIAPIESYYQEPRFLTWTFKFKKEKNRLSSGRYRFTCRTPTFVWQP
jgi:hypothetical protein